MPIRIYKRGRFWWLTGWDASGKRIHQSTGTIVEDEADQIRIIREKEGLDLRLLGPKACFTFDAAVTAFLDAGKSDRFIKPLLTYFAGARISELSGTSRKKAAKTLYPDAVYTTWNRQVVTPMTAAINHSADAGDFQAVKIKGFSKRDRDVRLPTTPPKRVVDRSYIDAFREHCNNKHLGVMMLFMFITGARLSDAMKLEPGDLDLANKIVTFRDMKNGDDGEGDLTIELVFELQQFEPTENGRVFGYKKRHGCLYRDIKATCKRAGIPYLGTHQPGRHSFATEMIVRHNIDVATTAAKGLWKSKALLMANYVHAEPGPSVIDQVFGDHVHVPCV